MSLLWREEQPFYARAVPRLEVSRPWHGTPQLGCLPFTTHLVQLWSLHQTSLCVSNLATCFRAFPEPLLSLPLIVDPALVMSPSGEPSTTAPQPWFLQAHTGWKAGLALVSNLFHLLMAAGGLEQLLHWAWGLFRKPRQRRPAVKSRDKAKSILFY